MAHEPIARQPGSLLEGSRLLEQVRRTRHDDERGGAVQLTLRPTIQLENLVIHSAHDEQGGCAHVTETRTREIRSATTAYDRGDAAAPVLAPK